MCARAHAMPCYVRGNGMAWNDQEIGGRVGGVSLRLTEPAGADGSGDATIGAIATANSDGASSGIAAQPPQVAGHWWPGHGHGWGQHGHSDACSTADEDIDVMWR